MSVASLRVPRPTLRALLVGVAGIAGVVAGRDLRVFPLIALGAGALALLAVALAGVVLSFGRTSSRWRFDRDLSPAEPVVGDALTVTLTATARRVAPSVELRERIGGDLRRAWFASTAALRWTATASKRGRFTSGPGALWRVDPMGLFQRRIGTAAAAEVIVRPRPIDVDIRALATLLRSSTGDDDRDRNAGGARGELRPYASGDDPRRINWKVSARTMATTTGPVVAEPVRELHSDDVHVLLDVDSLPPGEDRELALRVGATILHSLGARMAPGSRPATGVSLSIERAGSTVFDGDRIGPAMDALALVEELEGNGPVTPPGAVPRPESATILIRGPETLGGSTAAHGDDRARVVLVCDRAHRERDAGPTTPLGPSRRTAVITTESDLGIWVTRAAGNGHFGTGNVTARNGAPR